MGFGSTFPHGEVGYINLVLDWTKLFFISKQKATLKNFENPFNQQKNEGLYLFHIHYKKS